MAHTDEEKEEAARLAEILGMKEPGFFSASFSPLQSEEAESPISRLLGNISLKNWYGGSFAESTQFSSEKTVARYKFVQEAIKAATERVYEKSEEAGARLLINACFAEIEDTRQRMQRDQDEIDHLTAQTRRALDKLQLT